MLRKTWTVRSFARDRVVVATVLSTKLMPRTHGTTTSHDPSNGEGSDSDLDVTVLNLPKPRHFTLFTMARQKSAPGVVNRHIYTRASYLYQAANYLAEASHQTQHESDPSTKDDTRQAKATRNLSRQLNADCKLVCQKSVIRQNPNMKRSTCKFCSTTLVEGETSQSIVENPSNGGKKPWADLIVVNCLTCGHAKRYPVSARKQTRKHLRQTGKAQTAPKEEDEARVAIKTKVFKPDT